MDEIGVIKSKISEMWQTAARYHTAGYMSKAVAGWAETLDYQQQMAAENGFPTDVVHLTDAGWTFPFGHLSALEVFAKMKILGMTDSKYVLVVEHKPASGPIPGGISNFLYFKLISKFFDVVEKSAMVKDIRLTEYYMTILKIDGRWEWFMDAWATVEDRWQAENHGPLLKLTPEQIEEGRNKLDLKEQDWFVTLHARTFTGDIQDTRNNDLSAHTEAIKLIGQAGGKVFTTPSGDKDLDIFLLSQARFVISGNSGPAYIAGSFGTPVLLMNFYPRGIKFPYKNAIIYYKQLWDMGKNCPLGEEEYCEPFIHITSDEILARYNVTAKQNTSEEVLQGVKQMMDRTLV